MWLNDKPSADCSIDTALFGDHAGEGQVGREKGEGRREKAKV
jgi:hypothetical protein